MAFDFTLRTQESSYLPTNAPSADSIYNALSRVSLPEGTGWVGPVAKIERYKQSGSVSWITAVTWVFEVQGLYAADANQAQRIASEVAASVDRALAPLSSDWSRATMVPYSESTQGPLSGWQSGHSAVPRFDSTALDQAEGAAVSVQQAGEDAAAFAARAGTQAQSFLGSLFSSAIDPINKKASNILMLLAVGAGAVLLVVSLPYLAAARTVVRRNPGTKRCPASITSMAASVLPSE